MNLFMFVLLAVWGFLYVNGRQRQAEKPSAPASPGGGSSGSCDRASSGGPSNGAGGGG